MRRSIWRFIAVPIAAVVGVGIISATFHASSFFVSCVAAFGWFCALVDHEVDPR